MSSPTSKIKVFTDVKFQPGSVTITNPGPETYVYYIAIGS